MAAATIKDVAREAKVSVASVSRALNDGRGVTAETSQRIREAAIRLRYVPHAAARTLITRRTLAPQSGKAVPHIGAASEVVDRTTLLPRKPKPAPPRAPEPPPVAEPQASPPQMPEPDLYK